MDLLCVYKWRRMYMFNILIHIKYKVIIISVCNYSFFVWYEYKYRERPPKCHATVTMGRSAPNPITFPRIKIEMSVVVTFLFLDDILTVTKPQMQSGQLEIYLFLVRHL